MLFGKHAGKLQYKSLMIFAFYSYTSKKLIPVSLYKLINFNSLYHLKVLCRFEQNKIAAN